MTVKRRQGAVENVNIDVPQSELPSNPSIMLFRWEVAPEYFQFLALHWHTVATTHPGLDGSQVQGKIWKKWVRGETPKAVRPKAKEVCTEKSVEVTMRALQADGFA